MNQNKPPHQQQVIDELDQLDDRINKLNEFIEGSPVFETLNDGEQLALKFQRQTMQTYAQILLYRVRNF